MKRVARHAAYTIPLWPSYILCGVRSVQTRYSSLITGPLSQIFSLDFTCTQNYMGAVTREAYSRATEIQRKIPTRRICVTENIRYSITIRNRVFFIFHNSFIARNSFGEMYRIKRKRKIAISTNVNYACFLPLRVIYSRVSRTLIRYMRKY